MKTLSQFITCGVRFGAPLFMVLAATLAPAQFTYVTNNGTITITGYTGLGGAVDIPNAINGLPVTRIGDYSFYSKTGVTGVTIPDGVTNIGIGAFSYCANLVDLVLPDSILRIGDSAFLSCSSLAGISIPNGVTDIGSRAFSDCSGLVNLTIPSSVLRIGDSAFGRCALLREIMIPNGVKVIGNAAFAGCHSLTNATIPETVSFIGIQPFHSCTLLDWIAVDPLNPVYCSVEGVLFNKSQTVLHEYPAGRTGDYAIPPTVSTIAPCAFMQRTALTGIAIPKGVTNIGYWAFYGCSALPGVTLPDSVLSIEYLAFSGCTGLTNIAIPRNVTSIGFRAFTYCKSATAINVEEANPAYASVAGVLFDKNKTALLQCPAGQTGNYIIPDGVGTIGEAAFDNCLLANIVIPDSVVNIDAFAFVGCSMVTSFTIPGSVTNIGQYAFDYCPSLTNVTIGEGVTKMGYMTFYYCTSLTNVYFRGSPPTVELDQLFYRNQHATVYYLPGTTGWGATFGGRPTALWRPKMLTGDASFGVRTNQFGFNISWAGGMTVAVEASTNLTNPVWTSLQTNVFTVDTLYFGDPQWMNYPMRFYRLRWP